jgi:hypothetical protein
VIRVICPNCRAKLNAKDELVGQTRNCPGCGHPVVIRPTVDVDVPQETGDSGAKTEAGPLADVQQAPIAPVEAPTRLGRSNWYLICDPSRIIAAWENNGQGWRIRTDYGYASAARNPASIPNQGDFKLVELRMAMFGEDLRLRGILVYQLIRRWALTGLGRGDDLVCQSITGLGSLVRAQKDAIRMQLQERFMRTVWGDAAEVLDYLANGDYHSPGAGQ